MAKARTWEHLSLDEGVDAAALAGELGVKTGTVRKHLRALAKLGLAEHRDGAWMRGPADPDDVAVELGTAGASEAQRARHERERQMRAEARAAYAAAMGSAPFTVDPETGEIIDVAELAEKPPHAKGWRDAPTVRESPGADEVARLADALEPAEAEDVTTAAAVEAAASTLAGSCTECGRPTGLGPVDARLCSRCRPGPPRQAPPAELLWAPDLPPGLSDLPLDVVTSCRVCGATTVTTDGTGAICRSCHDRSRGINPDRAL